MSESKSWAKRVIARLKGGDEAKLSKFHKEYLKSNDKQISSRADDILELKERQLELEEQQQESSETIDCDRIAVLADRKIYLEEFRATQVSQIRALDVINDDIETKEAEIAMYKQLNSLISA